MRILIKAESHLFLGLAPGVDGSPRIVAVDPATGVASAHRLQDVVFTEGACEHLDSLDGGAPLIEE